MHEHEYDVVIIGSGAGGGTVAKELASLCADGVRIAVLEWGPKLRPEEYSGHELEMARRLYFDSGGVLTRDRSMTLAMGRAYGGSTVIYTGTSLSMPEEVVRRWAVPGLEHADLQRRCERYLVENNVHLLPEELINDNNRLFVTGCQRLGYRVKQFPINVAGCRGAGVCNLGCVNQAKQGTYRVQLPAAERQGVEVVTNCRVDRVVDGVCEAEVVEPGFGEPSAWQPGKHRVRARAVVVCCGGVSSPALLLRSGLRERLPVLGRYLTLHPALILVGEHERTLSNHHGHPKSYYCDQFVGTHGFLLETCMYFPFTTAKNLIGFGEEHSCLMHAFRRLQMILVLALDPARADNRVTLDGQGNPVVDYTLSDQVLDALHESMKVSAKVFFAAGAQRVHVPAARRFLIEAEDRERLDELVPRSLVKPGRISISSAHIMGGCRMGTGSGDSVTSSWGEVHGVPWLFVADSSLFPRCSEVNPYLTVMALADRVAERVRQRLPELAAR